MAARQVVRTNESQIEQSGVLCVYVYAFIALEHKESVVKKNQAGIWHLLHVVYIMRAVVS
jgi:hypothetical protein